MQQARTVHTRRVAFMLHAHWYCVNESLMNICLYNTVTQYFYSAKKKRLTYTSKVVETEKKSENCKMALDAVPFSSRIPYHYFFPNPLLGVASVDAFARLSTSFTGAALLIGAIGVTPPDGFLSLPMSKCIVSNSSSDSSPKAEWSRKSNINLSHK